MAIFTKEPVDIILDQLPGDAEDEQARYLEIDYQGLRIINIYLPNGNPVDSDKYDYKLEIRSMSEETGHSVLINACINTRKRLLVMSLPYIKELIPIGIVFKAMGFADEKDIRRLIGVSNDVSNAGKINRLINSTIILINMFTIWVFK